MHNPHQILFCAGDAALLAGLTRFVAAALDEGNLFDVLCDQARRAAAEAYLKNTTLSISEVTYLLGYSEPTAFHRACRRWFGGITAQVFREQHSQPNSS